MLFFVEGSNGDTIASSCSKCACTNWCDKKFLINVQFSKSIKFQLTAQTFPENNSFNPLLFQHTKFLQRATAVCKTVNLINDLSSLLVGKYHILRRLPLRPPMFIVLRSTAAIWKKFEESTSRPHSWFRFQKQDCRSFGSSKFSIRLCFQDRILLGESFLQNIFIQANGHIYDKPPFPQSSAFYKQIQHCNLVAATKFVISS